LGTGKTILTSLVVEKARKLSPAPVVLFFYCKHGDPDRNNFFSIARSLLAQLLKHDKGILSYFYQQCCNSGEASLPDSGQVEELLQYAFSNCQDAYIILDGLDECLKDETKAIVSWFRKLVDELPLDDPGRLRCLFVSQKDGGRKLYDGLVTISIRPEDIEDDIEEFSQVQSNKLKTKLGISDQEASSLATAVTASAEGE
jgi:hypothetical protein